jgi:hypothetical protein
MMKKRIKLFIHSRRKNHSLEAVDICKRRSVFALLKPRALVRGVMEGFILFSIFCILNVYPDVDWPVAESYVDLTRRLSLAGTDRIIISVDFSRNYLSYFDEKNAPYYTTQISDPLDIWKILNGLRGVGLYHDIGRRYPKMGDIVFYRGANKISKLGISFQHTEPVFVYKDEYYLTFDVIGQYPDALGDTFMKYMPAAFAKRRQFRPGTHLEPRKSDEVVIPPEQLQSLTITDKGVWPGR